MLCPKCGVDAADAAECQGCGLVFARYRATRERRSQAPVSHPTHSSRAPLLLCLLAAALLTGYAVRRGAPPDDAPESEASGATVPATPRAIAATAAVPVNPGPTPNLTPNPDAAVSARIITADTVTEAMIRELELDVAAKPDDTALIRTLADAYAVMGERLHHEGKLDTAIPYYQRALTRDPSADLTRLLLTKALFAAGRVTEARVALAAVGETGRREPLFHVLNAELYYAAEDLEHALSAYRDARTLAADPALDERIARLEREIAASPSSRTLQSRRFRVYFDGPENAATGRVVLAALERSYDELRGAFPVSDFTVPAILYAGRNYLEVTGAPDWSGGLFDGKIRLPVGGLRTIDSAFLRAIKHELTHAFVTKTGGNAVPRWLHEGFAQHYEGRRLADLGVAPDDLAALAGRAEPTNPRLFYAQALARMQYLMARYGERKVIALLEAIQRSGDADAAIRSTLRADPDRLFAELGKSQ